MRPRLPWDPEVAALVLLGAWGLLMCLLIAYGSTR